MTLARGSLRDTLPKVRRHRAYMSFEAFQKHWPENVLGNFYVGDQCHECELCRELVPEVFARNNVRDYSFIKKQPETPDELARCREALAGCCTETIYEDGVLFDQKSKVAVRHSTQGHSDYAASPCAVVRRDKQVSLRVSGWRESSAVWLVRHRDTL